MPNTTSMPRLPIYECVPQYRPTSIVRRVFRFINQHTGDEGLQTYQISPAKVCALQVIGSVVNSQVVQIYESARIRKIRIWVSPATDGNIGTARIEFAGTIGGIIGPNRSTSTQSVGVSNPGFLQIKPDPASQAAQWFNGDVTATVAQSEWFRVVINASGGTSGTINIYTLDLDVELRMTTDARLAAASGVTVTTAAVGAFYNLALDNNAGGTLSSSNNWSPSQSLITTTFMKVATNSGFRRVYPDIPDPTASTTRLNPL